MMEKRISIPELGKRISYFRKKKLLTQKELGNRLGISDKTISKWEKGTIAPDITLLESLAKILGVKLDDLLVVNNEEVKTKRKRTIYYYFIVMLLIIVIPFIVFYLYNDNNSNKWIAHELISLNDQYLVEGYVLSNGDESRIVFTKLFYKNDSFDIVDARLEIVYDENIIEKDNFIDDVAEINAYLFEASNRIDVHLQQIDYEYIKSKKLYIKLFYKDKKEKEQIDKIELGLK